MLKLEKNTEQGWSLNFHKHISILYIGVGVIYVGFCNPNVGTL